MAVRQPCEVAVAVRIRPLVREEADAADEVAPSPLRGSVADYEFDSCLDACTQQEDVFAATMPTLLDAFMQARPHLSSHHGAPARARTQVRRPRSAAAPGGGR